MTETKLFQAVEDAFESVQLPFFRRLVEQPSHTRARDDVEAAACVIDELADEIGLRREAGPDPDGVFADHRIYSTPATGDHDRAFLMAGHVDTVYPRSQGFLEFQREGDVVRGPGVLDMKSGLTVVLFAMRALQQAEPEKFASIKARFVCNTDEEVGSPSSRPLYDRIAKLTTAAMVFEGGREADQIITSRKGSGSFTLTVTGHEAHAGNEHASGVNAIHVLSLLVPRIEALTDYDKGTSVNVGTIEGGTAKNTVPGKASCVIDTRVCTASERDRITTALNELASNPLDGVVGAPERLNQAAVELAGKMLRPPMEATEESRRLMRAYEQHAHGAGLQTGEAPLQGGGSDANLLAACGVPVIDGLGPYGRYFHSTREWSSVESLIKRTKALACFLAADVELFE